LPSLAVAAFLMLIARPLAVFLSLFPFRFPLREQLYIGWVGLRGAVPVVLALFPMIYGADNARLFFNVAFFIVLISLLLQGWTIAPAARWLGLEVPPPTEPRQRVTLDVPGHFEHELLCYEVRPGSVIAGRGLSRTHFPEGAQVMAVMREGMPQALGADMVFAPGDYVYLVAQSDDLPQLSKLFDPHQEPEHLEPHHYFGDFVLNGGALTRDVAAAYGFTVPHGMENKTLAQYLAELFHDRVVVGDRARLGDAELVVREIEDGTVTRVGLRLG
jgi:cell volume regulation protein A